MPTQTTVRFDQGEDLREDINRACAVRMINDGERISMNGWIVEAIREKLSRENKANQ